MQGPWLMTVGLAGVAFQPDALVELRGAGSLDIEWRFERYMR